MRLSSRERMPPPSKAMSTLLPQSREPVEGPGPGAQPHDFRAARVPGGGSSRRSASRTALRSCAAAVPCRETWRRLASVGSFASNRSYSAEPMRTRGEGAERLGLRLRKAKGDRRLQPLLRPRLIVERRRGCALRHEALGDLVPGLGVLDESLREGRRRRLRQHVPAEHAVGGGDAVRRRCGSRVPAPPSGRRRRRRAGHGRRERRRRSPVDRPGDQIDEFALALAAAGGADDHAEGSGVWRRERSMPAEYVGGPRRGGARTPDGRALLVGTIEAPGSRRATDLGPCHEVVGQGAAMGRRSVTTISGRSEGDPPGVATCGDDWQAWPRE